MVCKARGISKLATEVHHVERVGGSIEKLWGGETVCVCSECHSLLTGLERRGLKRAAAEEPPRTDSEGVPTAEWMAYREARRKQRRNSKAAREAARC